jgi:hypothetical protein
MTPPCSLSSELICPNNFAQIVQAILVARYRKSGQNAMMPIQLFQLVPCYTVHSPPIKHC